MKRPGKLDYWMSIAEAVSKRSHDTETQVGAIIIDEDGMIMGSGHNGFVRGAPDNELPTTRDDGKYPYMIHAEQNIISQCAKKGIVCCPTSPT